MIVILIVVFFFSFSYLGKLRGQIEKVKSRIAAIEWLLTIFGDGVNRQNWELESKELRQKLTIYRIVLYTVTFLWVVLACLLLAIELLGFSTIKNLWTI